MSALRHLMEALHDDVRRYKCAGCGAPLTQAAVASSTTPSCDVKLGWLCRCGQADMRIVVVDDELRAACGIDTVPMGFRGMIR